MTIEHDPVRRVFSGSAWLVGAYVAAFAIALIQSVILARGLGARVFGLLAIVIAIVTFVQQLIGSRVWETVTTFVTAFREHGDDVRAAATLRLCLVVDAVASLAAIAALWIGAAPLARLFGVAEAAGEVRWYAVGLIFAIPVSTATALLRVAGRFDRVAVHTIAENAIRFVVVLGVLALSGAVLRDVVIGYVVAAAMSGMLLIVLARPIVRAMRLPRLRDVRISALGQDRGRIVSFLLYSNVSATARLVTGRLDVLLVAWLTDPSTVGVYRLARTVADPLAALTTPVSHAVFPEVSRLVQARDADGVRRLVSRIRRVALAVILPVCMATAALVGWVVPGLFGAAFEGAVPLVRIMVWQLVWVPFIWVPSLLLSLGRARAVAAITLIDAVVYTLLLLALVPPYGAAGAAWATVLRFAAWTAVAAPIGSRAEQRMELRWT